MTNETLREQITRIQAGDEVEVVFRLYGIERPSVSGEAWADDGVLYIGNSTLRYPGGTPVPTLARIVSHTPKRRPIKRGHVVKSREDAERWDVPKYAIFRLPHGGTVIVGAWPPVWPDYFFPARCVDLLSDWEDES